ncbi:hypothetical protein SSX86_009545 [Deinandra increscens subsp. villosa]|uniref:Uncharacterized protein n=1 Tax=Deinandra increscens subsp. villosa TaxID=3103831 RepID=A0AAP0H444_9ASTR
MKGYSKIMLMNSSSKSRSMDSSDPTVQNQKPISIKKSTHPITQKPAQNLDHDHDYDYNRYSGNNQENNQEKQDEDFSITNRSLTSQGTTTDANGTSGLSSRFKIEKQHSTGRTLQTAMKRVVSIRRSSSVSERYSRIHDQGLNIQVDFEEEGDGDDGHVARSKKKTKRRSGGRVLEACKRVFGL